MSRSDAAAELPPERRPAEVLAWSESRLNLSASGHPSLALWRPLGCWAAIGIGQSPERELDVEAMRRDGVGFVRRQSGGGAVLLSPGVLCWEAWGCLDDIALLGNGDTGIRSCYTFLSLPVIEGLKSMGIAVFQAGICDISVTAFGGTRKMAGTAQLRRRDMVLVHGSLLVNPDMDVMSRYLRHPGDEPEYRQGRSHRDFCLSVREALDAPAESDYMAEISCAATAWAADAGWELPALPDDWDGPAEKLAREKYLSPDWNWKKIRPQP